MAKQELISNITYLIENIGINKLSSKIIDDDNEFLYNRELFNTTRNLVFHRIGNKTYKITINKKSTKYDLIPVNLELQNLINC